MVARGYYSSTAAPTSSRGVYIASAGRTMLRPGSYERTLRWKSRQARQLAVAHLLFCKTAANISSIIGHTCGVERAGKAYKQVLTSLRKSMEEAPAMKVVYVYANYGLLELKHTAGDALGAFSSDDHSLQQEVRAEETDPHAKFVLRCMGQPHLQD